MQFTLIGAFLVFYGSTLTRAQQSRGDAPRFSIGLGILSPSYSQKLSGNGRLDVSQDDSGYSYSLKDVVHPQSSSPYINEDSQSHHQPLPNLHNISPNEDGDHQNDDQSSEPRNAAHFSIYHHRQTPKQFEQSDSDSNYDSDSPLDAHSPSDDDFFEQSNQETSYKPVKQVAAGRQKSQHSYQPQQHQSYNGPQHQSYNGPQLYAQPRQYDQYHSQQPVSSHGQQLHAEPASGRYGNYDFQQAVSHQPSAVHSDYFKWN